MRKTTISLATFSSLLSLALGGAACGKRGDPLPPLRPVPGTAENVVVRQVADRIRLEWTAPVRNTDGTTEKVALREARVLRRVLDLEALVAAQTVPVEPEPSLEAAEEAQQEPLGDEVAEAAEPEPVLPSPPEPPPELADAASAPPEPAAEGVLAALDADVPPARQRPKLRIPPFGGDIVATLDSEELGATLLFEETVEPSLIGKRLEYAVVYVNGSSRESPLSTVAQIEPHESLAPPRDVAAEAGDGFVRVAWLPPATESPEALAFAVYRRAESAPGFPARPLPGSPLSELAFEDRAASFGTPLCYAVKTLWRPTAPDVDDEEDAAGEAREAVEEPPDVLVPIVPPIANPPVIESDLSEELCLTAVDRFPPPAPSDLVAVPSGAGILLTWREVDVPDLAGYRVYRGDRPGAVRELIAEVTGGSTTDVAALPGRTYYYAVTAIDDAPGVNESDRTNVVEAARP